MLCVLCVLSVLRVTSSSSPRPFPGPSPDSARAPNRATALPATACTDSTDNTDNTDNTDHRSQTTSHRLQGLHRSTARHSHHSTPHTLPPQARHSMSDLKTALIVNTNSILGLQLIRKIGLLNYNIISVQCSMSGDDDDDAAENRLQHIPLTNPELKDRFINLPLAPSTDADSNDAFDAFSILPQLEAVLNGKPIDLVVDLNSTTAKKYEKWDLKLVLALFQKNIITPSNTTVIIGNSNYNSNLESSSLDALHSSVLKLTKDLSKSNINCIDYTQINALPGDESYIADTYLAEVMRNSFKVPSINSFIDLLKFIIYSYFPGFLISPMLFLFALLNINSINKQKSE